MRNKYCNYCAKNFQNKFEKYQYTHRCQNKLCFFLSVCFPTLQVLSFFTSYLCFFPVSIATCDYKPHRETAALIAQDVFTNTRFMAQDTWSTRIYIAYRDTSWYTRRRERISIWAIDLGENSEYRPCASHTSGYFDKNRFNICKFCTGSSKY